MYTYLNGDNIENGDLVHIAEDRPIGFGQDDVARIVVINPDDEENAGKLIGVEFNSKSKFLHSCDGAAEDNQGWWTRPENLAKAAS